MVVVMLPMMAKTTMANTSKEFNAVYGISILYNNKERRKSLTT